MSWGKEQKRFSYCLHDLISLDRFEISGLYSFTAFCVARVIHVKPNRPGGRTGWRKTASSWSTTETRGSRARRGNRTTCPSRTAAEAAGAGFGRTPRFPGSLLLLLPLRLRPRRPTSTSRTAAREAAGAGGRRRWTTNMTPHLEKKKTRKIRDKNLSFFVKKYSNDKNIQHISTSVICRV